MSGEKLTKGSDVLTISGAVPSNVRRLYGRIIEAGGRIVTHEDLMQELGPKVKSPISVKVYVSKAKGIPSNTWKIRNVYGIGYKAERRNK